MTGTQEVVHAQDNVGWTLIVKESHQQRQMTGVDIAVGFPDSFFYVLSHRVMTHRYRFVYFAFLRPRLAMA